MTFLFVVFVHICPFYRYMPSLYCEQTECLACHAHQNFDNIGWSYWPQERRKMIVIFDSVLFSLFAFYNFFFVLPDLPLNWTYKLPPSNCVPIRSCFTIDLLVLFRFFWLYEMYRFANFNAKITENCSKNLVLCRNAGASICKRWTNVNVRLGFFSAMRIYLNIERAEHMRICNVLYNCGNINKPKMSRCKFLYNACTHYYANTVIVYGYFVRYIKKKKNSNNWLHFSVVKCFAE